MTSTPQSTRPVVRNGGDGPPVVYLESDYPSVDSLSNLGIGDTIAFVRTRDTLELFGPIPSNVVEVETDGTGIARILGGSGEGWILGGTGESLTLHGHGESGTGSGVGDSGLASGLGESGEATGSGESELASGLGEGGEATGSGESELASGLGEGGEVTGSGESELATGTGEGVIATGTGEGVIATGTGEGVIATGTGEGVIATGTGEGIIATGTGAGGIGAGEGEGGVAQGEGAGASILLTKDIVLLTGSDNDLEITLTLYNFGETALSSVSIFDHVPYAFEVRNSHSTESDETTNGVILGWHLNETVHPGEGYIVRFQCQFFPARIFQ